MSKMYESLMGGLMEDLQDNQIYGEPQGRKTVIKKNCELENHGNGYLGANGISIFQFDDEREFVEEMNNA